MTTNHELIARFNDVHLGNYRPAPVVFDRGLGCELWDVEGKRYLDLCAGLAVVSVGHSHPKFQAAVAAQAGQLTHVSNLFHNARAIELAHALQQRTPFSRFFFCNSGAEANEALLKLARKHFHTKGDVARTQLVAAHNSFHGRTMGALALTGQPKYHEGMGPMLGGVSHVPYGDLDALANAVDSRTAAVFLEPIQGEGGIVVASDAYLRGARDLCDREGALLFFDEIQTGIGRTGRFLASEWSGVLPDACSLAKGLAAGFPIGAIAVTDALADALPPGSHATTFGGNPLACAASLAVLEIVDAERLVHNADQVGLHLHARLAALATDPSLPSATEARGRGLLQGLVLASGVDPAKVLALIREAGVLLSLAGGHVLRFSPPLSVTRAQIDEGVAIVESVLRSAPRVSLAT
jgi:predicted acetylornithine/succinylornithine family transaminase